MLVITFNVNGIRARIHQLETLIQKYNPNLFICGHSHILKVIQDKKYNHLHFNPGAAGFHGFHKKRTMLKFSLQKGTIKNLFVIELK